MSYKIIYGSKGENILVDNEDYERLVNYSWNCHAGYARRFERRKSNDNKLKSYLMHREILIDIPEGKVVDHINGNPLDNRKSNLRLCVTRENSANRKIAHNCSNKYLGVTYHKRDKRWQAQVRHKGIRYYCGYYKTQEEAAKAYDDKAKELHGEFAKLNFPIEEAND